MSTCTEQRRSIVRNPAQLAMLLLALACGLCGLAGCGGSSDATVVQVGKHAISSSEVTHWISTLKARGTNGREPGPPAPVPPRYTACIAYLRAHPIPASIAGSTTSGPPLPRQPKAYCAFEYRRFKLKALYLLISYRWIEGEASELGVHTNKPELARDLAAFRRELGLTADAAYKRYLGFIRADTADLLMSYEMELLTQAIEAKIAGPGLSPPQRERALARFGKAFKAKWLARTDCRSGYVVPICRQYKPGKTPPEFVPPSVPLTDMPSGG
jgi:hypothetical protein